jgi:hypothetical protein
VGARQLSSSLLGHGLRRADLGSKERTFRGSIETADEPLSASGSVHPCKRRSEP